MAVILGVRWWTDRVALVAVEGEPGGEVAVKLNRRTKLPPGATDAERARWVHKTVIEAIQEADPDGVAARISDAEADQLRAEHDGITLVAAAERGLAVATLRRQSMTKHLQIARQPGAWKAFPKADPFVSSFVGDEQDAAMAARAMLNRGTAS